MTKELKVIEAQTKTPAIAEAVDQYNMMVEYVQTVMKDGIDYGVVPGTKKPTLLKPGAEKLQRLFKLRSTFEAIDIKENWEGPFFYYRYKCQIWSSDQVIAECEGSTNSYEKKYRYRYVFDNKATPEEKEQGLLIERTGRNGQPYTSYRIENKEIYDQVNTLQKMAQKRAYVGAILLAANASEFFTQDMEDLSIVDAEFTEKKPEKKQEKRQPQSDRPYNPAIVKAKIDELAGGKFIDGKANKPQRGLMVGMLEACFAVGDTEMKRKEVCQYLTGQGSSKDIPDNYILALLEWIKPVKDSGGAYSPDEFVPAEANKILTTRLKELGQLELDS